MTAKRLPAVEVEWIDSVGTSGWGKYERTDMRCRSVGMLYSRDKDRIVLCLNQSAYSQGDYMEIPQSAIKRVTRLRGNMPHKSKKPNYPGKRKKKT